MHQWIEQRGKKINYRKYYSEWLFNRKTLKEISSALHISLPTLQQEFDKIIINEGVQHKAPNAAINLLVDATFFGREYGYLCFHDTERIIYFAEIKTETTSDLRYGLRELIAAGYKIKSVTIDDRSGYYNAVKKILGPVPVQLCLFHQKAIIRRYIGDKPDSVCGQELKILLQNLCKADQCFINSLYELKQKYKYFLSEKNEFGNFRHANLRAAFRSLQNNLSYLFTFTDMKELNIPSTINHLEGLFGHLKTNLKIHRGLSKKRKKNAIKFFLKFF